MLYNIFLVRHFLNLQIIDNKSIIVAIYDKYKNEIV
jgi:hypothetical protein